MNDELRALVKYRLEQADECLESAQILLDRNLRRGAVNRAYYAMFYGVLALLAVRGLETSKHTGAIALFDREFVKAGLFGRDLSTWLHETFYLRQQADYRPMIEVAQERARAAVDRARDFVSAVKTHLGTALGRDQSDE